MRKKLMSLVLAAALMVTMVMPVMADTISDNESHQQTVEVTAELEQGYVVSLPARIALEGNNGEFTADYEVLVTGNLVDGNYVSVDPSSSFQLVNTTDATKKFPASVTQSVTKWSNGSVGSKFGTKAEGHISAKITANGAYKGDFVFTYQQKSGSSTTEP